MIKLLLLVGAGSFMGGILRYLVTILVNNRYISSFPFGTLAVNIIGCFFIGLVFGLTEKEYLHTDSRLFLATGVLGGFTTFSSFSNETLTLLRDGQYIYAFTNVGLSLFLGLLATFLGILIVKYL